VSWCSASRKTPSAQGVGRVAIERQVGGPDRALSLRLKINLKNRHDPSLVRPGPLAASFGQLGSQHDSSLGRSPIGDPPLGKPTPYIDLHAQPADLALGDAAGLAPRPSPPPRLYGPDPGRRGRSRPCAARGWRSSTVRGARLKGAVAIAVALVWRALSPGSSQSRPLDFPLHQTLGGKADPLAQRIAVACL